MKVSIGMNLQTGPWGGGNQFGRSLTNYLCQRGVKVSFDLKDRDLDLIVLTEPRLNLKSSAYSDKEIFRYLRQVNQRTIAVHRVNECDERKGTTGVNCRLIHANLCADHTVFVSRWLRRLFVRQNFSCESYSIIRNGSDRTIFHREGYRPWDRKGPMKLVTHHWGGHWMKGFDIYERLDQLLATDRYRGRITFTYIGNTPAGFRFRNSTYIEPMHGDALANALKEHHVYLTASRNEPGSNHQDEGANCGLPLLYRQSGCLPEYCEGYGVSFTEEDFEQKLETMRATYDQWVYRMKDYPHTAERTSEQYYHLFVELLDQRDRIIRRRKWWRMPLWLVKSIG